MRRGAAAAGGHGHGVRVPDDPPPPYYSPGARHPDASVTIQRGASSTPPRERCTPRGSASGSAGSRGSVKTKTLTSPGRFVPFSRVSGSVKHAPTRRGFPPSPVLGPQPPPYGQHANPPLVMQRTSIDGVATGGGGTGRGSGRRRGSLSATSAVVEVDTPVPESAALDGGGLPPSSVFSRGDAGSGRTARFQELLLATNADLVALRKLSWGGIPAECRATVWKLLLGYLPTNQARREQTLMRKRAEYRECVPRYLERDRDEYEEAIFKQISIDVPRTCPGVDVLQFPTAHAALTRLLYVWAVRHPATSYVQGINDLAAPFFIVFLSEFEAEVLTCDLESVDVGLVGDVEADSYWCLTKLLDGIQDRYTFAQPGIQRDVVRLKELVHRIDAPLDTHLERAGVDFLQFAFRWMNCLLTRELSIELAVRLWDSYCAEDDGGAAGGFAVFHLYVCAAFLVHWSKQLRARDFQECLLFLQHAPTEHWGVREVEELLAQGYTYKSLFLSAPNHLK